MAPSVSISQIPSELVIQIFPSCDNIADAVHLAKASHFLLSVWQLDLHAICRVVLRRGIDHYDEAHELAIALIEHQKHDSNPHANPAQGKFLESGINKEKFVLFLSKTVKRQYNKSAAESHALRTQKNTFGHGIQRPDGTWLRPPLEDNILDRDGYFLLYYRLWILAVIPISSAEDYIAAHSTSDQLDMAKFAHERMLAPRVCWPTTHLRWRPFRDWDSRTTVLPRLYWKLAENFDDVVGSLGVPLYLWRLSRKC